MNTQRLREREARSLIKTGWVIRYVAPLDLEEDLPYAYTVGAGWKAPDTLLPVLLADLLDSGVVPPGLTPTGCPDVYAADLPPVAAMHILNDVQHALHAGFQPTDGVRYTGLLRDDVPLVFREMVQEETQLAGVFTANRHLVDTPHRVLQLYFPDADGRFPWEPGATGLAPFRKAGAEVDTGQTLAVDVPPPPADPDTPTG